MEDCIAGFGGAEMKSPVKVFLVSMIFIVLILSIGFIQRFFLPVNYKGQIVKDKSDGMKKVFSRVGLEHQAFALARTGRFDEAIVLYQQAIQPEYVSQDYQKSTAIGTMGEIYKWKHDYAKAMEMADWFPSDGPIVIEKREIDALRFFQETGKPEKVYEHIQLLRSENKEELPPIGYGLEATILISGILRLYNTIGDHDAGIKFVDEILNWAYSTQEDLKKIQHVSTANEALRIGKWDDLTVANRDPEWRAYKFLWQYLTIREAFEQDKREGFKGCAHSKPGEVCMGRATKALIQSDYFPW